METTEVTLVSIEGRLFDFNRYIRAVDSQNREIAIISIEVQFNCVSISISSFGRQLDKVVIEDYQKPNNESVWQQVNTLLNKNGLVIRSEETV